MKFLPYQSADALLQAQAFELYESSFPAHERRSRVSHGLALGDPEFFARVVTSDLGELMAIFFYWKREEMIYVEHIAVNPLMRGMNIGSTVLGEFVAENDGCAIILEIDPPVDDVSVRRLRFYSHLGFVRNGYEYVHPSYSVGGMAHDLVILSYGRELSQDEYAEFEDYMRNHVLKYID